MQRFVVPNTPGGQVILFASANFFVRRVKMLRPIGLRIDGLPARFHDIRRILSKKDSQFLRKFNTIEVHIVLKVLNSIQDGKPRKFARNMNGQVQIEVTVICRKARYPLAINSKIWSTILAFC